MPFISLCFCFCNIFFHNYIFLSKNYESIYYYITNFVFFNRYNIEFYNQDITIDKGTTLGDQYFKQKHPLFQFVDWKFPNGDILKPDTPINSDTTVYADYKMDSQYKILSIRHQKDGWIEIEDVYSDEDKLKVTTISGETRYANDIINLVILNN